MNCNQQILKLIFIIFGAIVYLSLLSRLDIYGQVTTINQNKKESWNIYAHKFQHDFGGNTETVSIIKSNGHNILSHALVDLNEKCSKKFSIKIHEEEKALVYQPVDEYERSEDSQPKDKDTDKRQRLDYVFKPVFWGKGDIITAMVKPYNVQIDQYIKMAISSFMQDKYEAGIANLACRVAGELLKNEGRGIPDCARVRKIKFGEFKNYVDTKYDRDVKSLVILLQSKLVQLLKGDKGLEVSGGTAGFDIEISGHLVSSGSILVASIHLHDNEGDFIDSIDEKIELPIAPLDEAIEIARKLDEALH